ncbi:MAG TPA: hypothetical protein VLT88_15565 [Desulfosarcina sp.]|nr:hypothetical protein [Desulfosarcina sp.]
MQTGRIFNILSWGVIGGIIWLGCSNHVSRAYYSDHPRSAREVADAWGEPVSVVMMDEGVEKRVYAIQDPYTDLEYRYLLIENGRVVASGLTDRAETGPSENPHTSVVFVPNDISRIYYDRFRTTVADLDRMWGDPLFVKQTANGIQYRVYEIQDPYTDFQYRKFIAKDGVVEASRISPSKGFDREGLAKAPRGVEVVELSRMYYQEHPTSQASVDRIWGPPVAVAPMASGLQKRIYRVKMPIDTAFSFRFFLIDDGMVVASGISDMVDAPVP